MSFSKRERNLVALCVIVVLFIGIPSVKQIHLGGGKSNIVALGSSLNRSRQEIARLRKEIARLEEEVRQFTWRESPEALPPLLLKALHRTAAEAGVSLTSFRPGRLQQVPTGSKMPITVQVRAPFPKAAAFLERLQDTQRRVALERVQVASTEASSDIVVMELRLSVYTSQPSQATTRQQQEETQDGRRS